MSKAEKCFLPRDIYLRTTDVRRWALETASKLAG
jgi:hypothetical protein